MTDDATMSQAGPTMSEAPPDGSDLVVEASGPDHREGLGLADSSLDFGGTLFAGVRDGEWDGMALAVNGTLVGLDAISFTEDPFTVVIQAGVGWLMEHISILREPLEVLTGDARQISALAQTWANVGAELSAAADDYESGLSTVASWDGRAATGYRTAATNYVTGLRGLAAHSRHTAQGVAMAGVVVATERAIVFDLLATFASRAVRNLLIAMAASMTSLGASVAAFLARLSVDVATTATTLAHRLARLLRALSEYSRRFAALAQNARAARAIAAADKARYSEMAKKDKAIMTTHAVVSASDAVPPGPDTQTHTEDR